MRVSTSSADSESSHPNFCPALLGDLRRPQTGLSQAQPPPMRPGRLCVDESPSRSLLLALACSSTICLRSGALHRGTEAQSVKFPGLSPPSRV